MWVIMADGMVAHWLWRVVTSGAVLGWMGLIFYLSSLSQAEMSQPLESSAVSWMGVLRSYVAHLVLYGFLASLAMASVWCWKSAAAVCQTRWAAAAATFAASYGVSDEYHQSLVVGRSSSSVDILVNALAAIGAVAGLYLVARWRRGVAASLPRSSL